MLTKVTLLVLLIAGCCKGHGLLDPPRFSHLGGQAPQPRLPYDRFFKDDKDVGGYKDEELVMDLADDGLEGIAIAAKVIVAIIFLPLLIPVILVPLLILLLIAYFIPVMQVQVPGGRTARKLGQVLTHVESTARFLYSLPLEEECLDRMICEAGRTKTTNFKPISKWIGSQLAYSKNWAVKRLGRLLHVTAGNGGCTELRCSTGRQTIGPWPTWLTKLTG